MNDQFKIAVLKTLAYFDIFDFALTKEELYHCLWNTDYTDFKLDYTDFLKKLDRLADEEPSIDHRHSFYFLAGRIDNVDKRQSTISIFEKKMKIARRAVRKMRWVPFVRAVFVCNTVAGGGLSEESDIDVFVVIKKKRIWLARFLITLILSLYRLRRNKKVSKDKICLSFYVTDDHLDISDVSIDTPDIYMIYWLDQLIPIYDPENVLADIHSANQWTKKFTPHNFQDFKLSSRFRVDNNKFQIVLRRFFEKVWTTGYGDLLESQAREIQKKKMSRNYDSVKDAPDNRVVISDSMLKFHENDRRVHFREEWEKRCYKFNLN
ncbi:MAG: hypothetical protein COX81_00480 [Candidatus Magasanikbacteria bacterium CG_4_10_14_0_2_um_filter_37_12]|uniref:Polymerase nucleotidyl transferase domain-containing protein n=1 Tax=Candidatus Magasanikbacteria bacterium CG_4_10_14_0_2_um_filter_37_12 TaxID=1974637 RepID=A0A2M7VA04_9BACT|nr:MAG: hypothetical protein COX81_00480 [Candidatus Magasanikbacteria bacterium CG_4_10_14_0_2_um_filter_37_12]